MAGQAVELESRAKISGIDAERERRARAADATSRDAVEANARAAAARAAKAERDLATASEKIATLESKLNSWSGLMSSAMKRVARAPQPPSIGRRAPPLQQQAFIINKAGFF